jgi:integrase
VYHISEQMGHASITITMDTYGHLFPNQKRTTGARLEAQLAVAKAEARAPVG